jgi:hypothetical protein
MPRSLTFPTTAGENGNPWVRTVEAWSWWLHSVPCPRRLLIQGALLSYIVVLVVLVNSENSDPGCKGSVIYGRELLLFFF